MKFPPWNFIDRVSCVATPLFATTRNSIVYGDDLATSLGHQRGQHTDVDRTRHEPHTTIGEAEVRSAGVERIDVPREIVAIHGAGTRSDVQHACGIRARYRDAIIAIAPDRPRSAGGERNMRATGV